MNLREYLFRKRITITDFSKILECSRAHLSKIVNGTHLPGKHLAKEIERATNGEVTVKDLLYKEEH